LVAEAKTEDVVECGAEEQMEAREAMATATNLPRVRQIIKIL
jgi:hypothetical protein